MRKKPVIGNVMRFLQFPSWAVVSVGWKDNPVKTESTKVGLEAIPKVAVSPSIDILARLILGPIHMLSCELWLEQGTCLSPSALTL